MKSFLIVVLALIGGLLLSWGVTVGFIKLITLCFGWRFSLSAATGIWLILYALRHFFGAKED